jgi:hypothetical protein
MDSFVRLFMCDLAGRKGADEDMSKDIVEMEAEEAYRLVLHQVTRWLERNVDPKSARVFFVTTSPTHAGAGGGDCYNQTSPMGAADAASYRGSMSRRMLQVPGAAVLAPAHRRSSPCSPRPAEGERRQRERKRKGREMGGRRKRERMTCGA